MKKLCVLALVALLSSCQNKIADEFGFTAAVQTPAEEPAPVEPSPVLTNTDFKVNIEVMLYACQTDKQPVLTAALIRAIQEWSKYIPISVKIYKEDPSVFSPFTMGPMVYHNRPCIVQVIMTDMQLPTFNYPEDVVGLWDSSNNQLLLDSDKLEVDSEAAYAVCLHELGHMFGVPHVIGKDEIGLTGYIVVPEAAQQYVMYPNYAGKDQNVLSPIEIKLAAAYVVNYMTSPAFEIAKSSKCVLSTSKH